MEKRQKRTAFRAIALVVRRRRRAARTTFSRDTCHRRNNATENLSAVCPLASSPINRCWPHRSFGRNTRSVCQYPRNLERGGHGRCALTAVGRCLGCAGHSQCDRGHNGYGLQLCCKHNCFQYMWFNSWSFSPLSRWQDQARVGLSSS